MYKNSKKYDPEELRENVYKKYSENTIAEKIIELYQNILGK